MKSSLLAIAVLSGLVTLQSCMGNRMEEHPVQSTTQFTGNIVTAEPGAAPKTFSVTAAPESVLLGKNSEALVKIKNLKALELSDPDGEITGIELSYDLEVTNKNNLQGSGISIYPSDFRLELDNGNKIAQEVANSAHIKTESTGSSTGNVFKLPAGTKPVMLHLFHDETRASIKMRME